MKLFDFFSASKKVKGETIYKTNFVKFSWFPGLNLAEEVWSDASEFTTFQTRKKYHIEKIRHAAGLNIEYILFDTREFKVIPEPEELAWFYENVTCSDALKNVKKCAIVAPASALHLVAVEASAQSESGTYLLTTEYFKTRKEALEWLNI